jgi:hypothetical protein
MPYFMMFLLFIALPVSATPKDELYSAYTRFLALKTFKADIQSSTGKYKTVSSVEFQAPDRYRIVTEGRPANLIIGSTMYMNIDGRSMVVPMPGLKAMLAQYRNPDLLKQLETSTEMESLGTEMIQQQVCKKYRYQITKPQTSSNTVWISASSGQVLQLEVNGTVGKKAFYSQIKYSELNNPSIIISAP